MQSANSNKKKVVGTTWSSSATVSLTCSLRIMSGYTLLVGGYRPNYSLISFDPTSAQLKVISDSPAPEDASWVEPASLSEEKDGSRIIYSLSESKGKAVSLKVEGEKVTVVSERDTHGGSCHGKHDNCAMK